MSKTLHLTFNIVVIFFLNISFLKADLQIPNTTILPAEVIKIQLDGLMNNDKEFKDSGIEQTWNFAHPSNKKNTGPLPKFKKMIKGNSYKMLLNHLTHTVTKHGGTIYFSLTLLAFALKAAANFVLASATALLSCAS